MNNINQNDGELCNDDLENVTGGFVEWIIFAGSLLVAAVFTASATNRRW